MTEKPKSPYKTLLARVAAAKEEFRIKRMAEPKAVDFTPEDETRLLQATYAEVGPDRLNAIHDGSHRDRFAKFLGLKVERWDSNQFSVKG